MTNTFAPSATMAFVDADLTFYSTAAQVISVMFFVVVFEARAELAKRPGHDFVVVGIATFVLVVGEAAALYVTSSGSPTDTLYTVVVIALVAGFQAIFALTMASRMVEVEWLRARASIGVVVIVAYLMALLTALLFVTA